MTGPKTLLFAAAAGIALLSMADPPPAFAASVTFAYGSLADGATDAQIQSYMNGQLGANGSVIVTGAIGSNSYTADGHVTGPVTVTVVPSHHKLSFYSWPISIPPDTGPLS